MSKIRNSDLVFLQNSKLVWRRSACSQVSAACRTAFWCNHNVRP